MTATITPAPVRKSLHVKAPPQKAFDVFTASMGRWWLKSHSVNASPMADVIIEPFVGGRWFERGEDGSECQWGTVLAWEPPARVLLAWQLDDSWKHNADLITEVEVRFTSEHGGTRVDFEHRNLERLGEQAARIRESFDAPGGWSGLLEGFAKLTESGEET